MRILVQTEDEFSTQMAVLVKKPKGGPVGCDAFLQFIGLVASNLCHESFYTIMTYIGHLLYCEIRYSQIIRLFCQLRGRSGATVPSSVITQKLGFSKYSRRFYEIKRQLKDDGVIDRRGKFV